MAFRNIKPSRGQSSTSPFKPASPESTGSEPRAAAPPEDAGSTGTAKRRQKPVHVTKIACTGCQKARTKVLFCRGKEQCPHPCFCPHFHRTRLTERPSWSPQCDGNKPCQRCKQRAEPLECTYEANVKQTKEDLVNKIKELEAANIVNTQILQALSADHRTPHILERLRNGELYENVLNGLEHRRTEDYRAVSPGRLQHSEVELFGEREMLNGIEFHWSTVTSNPEILDHLFQLYFSWVHPVDSLFSEGHFVDSYKRQSTLYCSSILVNAICAMSCHLHTISDTDDVDYVQLGRSFSDAVGLAIDPLDKNVTTIQALAVMFLVDCARGRSLRASVYLRMAVESLPFITEIDEDGFFEVLTSTRRGVWCLHIEWSQTTFQKPISAKPPDIEIENEDLDGFAWYDYRMPGDNYQISPCLSATSNRERAKLTDIIHHVASMYCSSGPAIGVDQILVQYERFLRWRGNLPNSIIDFERTRGQVLPHVLSLLILYNTAVTHLLCPLLNFDGIPSAPVKEVICEHTQHTFYLLDQQYRQQWSCRYQPVLQLFGILHLCEVVIKYFPARIGPGYKDGQDAVQFGLEALMQSRESFPIAGPLQDLLRRSAIENSIVMPQSLETLMASKDAPGRMYRLDEFVDAYTQPSYSRHIIDISKRYDAASFAAEWHMKGPALGFVHRNLEDRERRAQRSVEERSAQNTMEIYSLLNKN